MKIVDRKTFLAMPEGTVYSKYAPCWFGDLSIKGETAYNDWSDQSIADAVKANSTEEYTDVLNHAQKTGASFEMDFNYEGRDGLFDADQLFAVWERKDVEQLIARLQETLK